MRKVFFFMMVTIDGFFEGPNQDISWHNADNEEFNKFAIDQTGEVGTILFGRKTYQMMASYWPTEEAIKNDPQVSEIMNNTPKMVFSTTLDKADWQNSTLIKENAAQEIQKLKDQPGKDIAIFGSSDLTVSLIPSGVIDEFRIMVNPVVIGEGKRLFEGLRDKLDLKLLSSRVFVSGNILLTYSLS